MLKCGTVWKKTIWILKDFHRQNILSELDLLVGALVRSPLRLQLILSYSLLRSVFKLLKLGCLDILSFKYRHGSIGVFYIMQFICLHVDNETYCVSQMFNNDGGFVDFESGPEQWGVWARRRQPGELEQPAKHLVWILIFRSGPILDPIWEFE